MKNRLSKGGFKSEDVEGFSNLPKYIPFFYPKFVHPVHDKNGRMSFHDFFAFTDSVYLQVLQIVFRIIMKNSFCLKHLKNQK